MCLLNYLSFIGCKMKVTIVLQILVFVFVVNAEVETGYYWIDYVDGYFPSNAYQTNRNVSEYIGQVYNKKNGLFPVGLRIEEPGALFMPNIDDSEEIESVKILCSQYPHFFFWIKITNGHSLTNMVLGGAMSKRKLYIGKILRNGKFIVGKVDNGTLHISIDGRTEFIHKHFYVLIYEDNCRSHYSDCAGQLSKANCDCSECYEVQPV